MYPSETLDKLMLRMPDGMRPRLKAMAALNRRSLNAEVIFHLDRALRGSAATEGTLPGDASAAARNETARQSGPTNTHAERTSGHVEAAYHHP